MLPGQSRQIPAMAMQPGYPMMSHEDPNNVPQPVIMMTAAPNGQQYAFAPAMYPMPQNAMMGQQRFIPPPQYTMQMASTFRPMMRNDGQPLTEEQRRKMEKEVKQRQFVEQQRRLQDLSSLGNVKVDPDKLIESIIRQSETRHKVAPPTKLPGATSNTHVRDVSTTLNSASNEDVFGDFLSSSSSLSSNNEAQHPRTASSSLGTVAMTSSQLQQQITNDVDTNAVISGKTAAPSTSSILPGSGITEKPKDNVKDLASMMMQCSDLSVPKEAKRFERKTAVNEVHVTKAVSVTYNESKAARHWDSSTDSLSELFTLPAQPTKPPNVFESNPALPNNFKLPRWITGEVPVHDIYQQVLDAVTRDGMISTELVYPVLLRSGLPREALGYIWELCNRNTPGKLIREELFLILAMVSIAQNNMDYSSLAVLSKCPHAPVPNLGQFAGPVTQMHSMPAPDNSLVSGATSPLEHPSAIASQIPAPVPLGGSGVESIMSIAVLPQMPYTVTAADGNLSSYPVPSIGSAALPGYGYVSPGVAGAFPLGFPGNTPPPSVVSYVTPSSAVDDDFEDFQMAPVPLPGFSQPQVISQVTVPAASHGDTELMGMDFVDPSDKYSVFRELSTGSDVPTESIPAPASLLQPTSNSSTVVSNPNSSLESDFTEFASFADTSSSQIFHLPVGGNSDNFNSVLSTSPFVTAEKDGALSTTLETKSELDSSSRYAALKSLVSSPSVFNAKPVVDSWDNHVTDMVKNDLVSNGVSKNAENEGSWAAFSSVGKDQVSDGKQQPAGNTCRKDHGGTSDGDGWAEFESASNVQDFVVDKSYAASSSKAHVSIPASEVAAHFKNETMPTAGAANQNKVQNFFGQKNKDLRGPTTGLGISPLDFHPPELPDDEDDFDDFTMYPHLPKDGGSHGAVGISSLSAHYMEEDDSCDALPEEKNLSSAKSASYFGMTQSSSSNSLEFTGWKFQSNPVAKEPDVQSASSLDLRRNKMADSRDQSPQQDGDSQSVSSLDFPPAELEQKSTADEQSVASLELKAASPESEPQSSFADSSRIPDKTQQPTDVIQAAFGSNKSAQPHPVDLKELLEQGSLGRFGDRYSELMNEVQDSDKHAYEWERCLEMCYGILSEGSRIFGSLSSSSILNEILSTDEGSTYLKGLVEIYVVARRIEEEMKRVSISNSKLASQTKNITTEWNDIAAICAGNPVIPNSLDFTSCFLKADDYEARRKSCGVCLLNVDARSPASCLSGEVGSKALSYGGRQYHTTCANFWINCVSQTLPSLTIPELL